MYKITVLPEEIEKLPLGTFGGEIHVISHVGLDYLKAVAYLRRQSAIGFDTETRPVFSPGSRHNKVALLQLSTGDHAFLFRLDRMGLRKRLCAILSDSRIIKIGAACADDVRGLQKRGEFEGRNFVDLQQIVWEWGIRDKSVKKLAANILGVKISKTQQLSNWEAETLSVPQQKYAATDAWVCLKMYEKLLASEKHPLTPEQINPPQPQQNAVTPGQGDEKGVEVKKRKRRNNHKKRKKASNGENTVEERKG